MNKSPQHNQQGEPKQCKSEVEEMYFQNLETGKHLCLNINTEILDTMLKRIPLKKAYLKIVKLGSCMKQGNF